MINTKTIGSRLEKWRVEHGVSLKKIGEVLSDGETRKTEYITIYKRARRFVDGNPAMRISDLAKICEFTKLPVSYFID